MSHTAIDDLASKLKMDSYDVFMKNLGKAKKGVVYREEMRIAADLIDWKKNYHLHGDSGDGPVKRGLGMALHTWGGGAHPANCMLRIHPDGTVESLQGSQDIGTGTRTIIAITVAETLGLPLKAINVRLGSNEYPFARGSGGSTTVGGVSGPNRRAAQTALSKNYEPNEEVRNTLPDGILDLVGTKYDIEADELSVGKQAVWHGKKKVCTWKQACRLLGQTHLEVTGKGPKTDGLTSSQVGGVQMADVSVDTKTGIIRMNKFVAVQDCGLILDEMTAKSQIYGALIMGIAYALSEERITDHQSGRFINADLENYKLPRIGDIGELVVHIHQPASEYDRGVVGLGEPPVISPGAAISNAVANALGVRVPTLPMTPKRVLDALSKA
jgi:xanthine dehydrogenase YagR molybdenum-binding subunit